MTSFVERKRLAQVEGISADQREIQHLNWALLAVVLSRKHGLCKGNSGGSCKCECAAVILNNSPKHFICRECNDRDSPNPHEKLKSNFNANTQFLLGRPGKNQELHYCSTAAIIRQAGAAAARRSEGQRQPMPQLSNRCIQREKSSRKRTPHKLIVHTLQEKVHCKMPFRHVKRGLDAQRCGKKEDKSC